MIWYKAQRCWSLEWPLLKESTDRCPKYKRSETRKRLSTAKKDLFAVCYRPTSSKGKILGPEKVLGNMSTYWSEVKNILSVSVWLWPRLSVVRTTLPCSCYLGHYAMLLLISWKKCCIRDNTNNLCKGDYGNTNFAFSSPVSVSVAFIFSNSFIVAITTSSRVA